MRRSLISGAILASLILVCTSMAVMAAKPKPKPKAKPVAKPAAKPTTNHATAGTTQLKGEYADMGSTYTLGKGDYAMNVTLKSAEYSVDSLVIADFLTYPKADEKFLVLHLNLHNPQSREVFARYDSFMFTAVDSKDENHEFIQAGGVENTKSSFGMTMKPAQKVDIYTAIKVPAKGEMPKLIIKSPDELVLRYDLRGKVKPLPAPYADPEDKTGATALSVVPAKIGDAYPIGEFTVKVEGTSFRDKPLPDEEIAEGNHYLVLNVTIKNISPIQQFVRGDSFVLGIKDADGAVTQPKWDMYLASRDTAYGGNIEPGQEARARYIFEVPKDLDMKTLTITRDEDRTYQYDMSAVK